MILAAYAGAGKSTFARRVEGAVDLASMPYSRVLPPEKGTKQECEAEKAAPYLLRNLQYPYNYLLEILKAEREYDYVLIPTSTRVIRMLNEMGRTVVLCYPAKDQKEDYRQRFLARGNSRDFLEVFIDCWEDFLGPYWNREVEGIHVPLGKGQFLTDVKATIDAAAEQIPASPVEEAFADELRKKVEERRRGALCLHGVPQTCFYMFQDIQNPEERRFLYDIGRLVYELDLCTPMICDEEEVRILLESPSKKFCTSDQAVARRFVEEERCRWSILPREQEGQGA